MSESKQKLAMAQAAARIMCEDGIRNYAAAKTKAARQLGWDTQAPMPRNDEIFAEVLEHQRLYGGDAFDERLLRLRKLALRAMRLFEEFRPRLVGGVLSGAIGLEPAADRITIHAFADAPEELDMVFLNRDWDFDTDEHRFTQGRGTFVDIPLTLFEMDGVEIEIAVFPRRGAGHAPLSPTTGEPMRRAAIKDVQLLTQRESG